MNRQVVVTGCFVTQSVIRGSMLLPLRSKLPVNNHPHRGWLGFP